MGPPPTPTLTPEELFLAAVALLPQDPDALELEAVTQELEEQLKAVTEQLYALFTEEWITTLTAEAASEAVAPAPSAAWPC